MGCHASLIQRQSAYVISSPLLHHLVPLARRNMVLEHECVTADADLHAQKATYEEWIVTPTRGAIDERWSAPWVVRTEPSAMT